MYARTRAHHVAREILDRFAPNLPELRGRLSAVWVAEVAAVLDDAALAERVLPMLAPIASRNHAWGVMSMVCEGPVTRALGLAAAAARMYDVAVAHFESALARVDVLGAAPHRARIEVELAGVLERRGTPADRERAARLLDAARATADRQMMPGLLATIDTRDRGAPAPAPPAHTPGVPRFELRPEGDYWTVTCDGALFRLKDSRGLRILALLVASPDREFHVTDLAAPAGESGLAEDAGEALDARAVAAYKQRIIDLREQLAEAEGWSDQGRATRLREELDHVATELAGGLGLGGRARRASSSVERARVNVRKRVLDAIVRIGEHSASLAQHLERAVRTGTFCAYHPTGRSRVR